MSARQLDEEAIFNIARKLAPAQRDEYLRQVCDDDALRGRVPLLLQVHDDSQGFLQAPAAALTTAFAAPTAPESAGASIGPYKLLEPLGEGGMGTVWMAEQSDPVKRLVALKVVKAGLDSAQVLSRFEAERQALALMDHPNIAKVLDAGTTDAGRPFFVMELVKGIAITRYCDERRLSPRDRLALFIPVCRAVQHAHQKGIIHRDLKPSNVMIALYDGKPVPKVIDFGVAKATGQKLTDKTLFTSFGALVGTLEYMSPEQAELNQLDIDTRSDIYSLGVLLYELLTGSTPLDHKRLKEGALLETLRLIREEEPPRPSARLSGSATLPILSAQRHTEPAKLSKLMRGELDWMVMKALEKDRTRRYETANGLAEDIERYLKDEPVQAGPPAPTYRLRKFVKRNKAPVLAAAVVLVTLLAGIVGTTLGLVEAQKQSRAVAEQRDLAKAQKTDADQQRIAAVNARNEADKERERAEEARNQKAKQLALAESLVYDLQFREAYLHFQSNDLVRCQRVLDECRPDLRGPEYGYLVKQMEQQARTLRGHTGYLVLSGDGQRLFSCSADGTIQVWDVAADKEVRTLRGHKDLFDLVVSRDGKRLFVGSKDNTIKEWDVDAGKEIRTLRGHRSPWALSGDGQRLFSGGLDSRIKVWDVEMGKEIRTLREPWGVVNLAVSVDGKRLFAGGFADGTIKVWDVEADKEIRTLRGHGTEVRSMALSGDGKRLFSGSYQQIKGWDLETGKETLSLNGHTNEVSSLALSPDGKRLLSGSADKTIKVWDLETGKEIRTLRGHTGAVLSLALSGDGKRLLSGSADKTAKVWHLETGNDARTLPGLTGRVVSVALSGDGKRLFLGKGLDAKFTAGGRLFFPADGAIKVWDVEAGKEIRTLRGHSGDVPSLALSGDGKRLFSGSTINGLSEGDNTIKVWDVETGKEIRTLGGQTGAVLTLIPTGDGKRLVSASGDGVIRMWDLETGKMTRTLRGQAVGGHEGQLFPLALSSDGKRLFSGGQDNKIKVWDLETGQEIRTLPGHTSHVLSLALSGDGKRLYSGSADNTIKVWDLETGKEVLPPLRGNGGDVGSLVLSSDGKRLFSGGGFFLGDNTIKVWDLATGREVLSLPGHGYGVASLALSGDAKRLISVGRDGTVKIWDLDAGKEARHPR